MEENSNTIMVQGSNITMEKIKELILNVNRILWDKKLENKVQDYLDNLLKQMQNYH